MIVPFLLVMISLLGLPHADSNSVAKIQDLVITADELEKAAAADLLSLKVRQQQILEETLNRLVTEKVLSLEAASRGVTEADLLKLEVNAKVKEPTTEEISRIYAMNKARIKEPPEKVLPEIKESLMQQQRQKLTVKFTDELKAKYNVKTFLEPIRVQVESKDRPARGAANAPVTMVFFSDFECPYCVSFYETLKKVIQEKGDRVRLVILQFPLDQVHPHAGKAAEAAYCADDQGKFWEMNDELFKDRTKLGMEELKKKAGIIVIDRAKFEKCLSSGENAGRVKTDVNAARAVGVDSTPTLFINGRPVIGALAYEELMKIVEEELTRAKE